MHSKGLSTTHHADTGNNTGVAVGKLVIRPWCQTESNDKSKLHTEDMWWQTHISLLLYNLHCI